MVDVVIVGGGPAGLSAALILGRSRRSVFVFDTGNPRNAASHALHGFLTRDGMKPSEFLQIARDQLSLYPSVQYEKAEVIDAVALPRGFEVHLKDGRKIACRRLLFATGVVDNLPEVKGTERFYGRSIFHCPYCDGWEYSDKRIALYGKDQRAHGLALKMKNWSKHLTLCTDGPAELNPEQREQLKRNEIALNEKPLERFEGTDHVLERIVFQDQTSMECDAVFFSLGQQLHSELPAKLGAERNEKGSVKTGDYESTCVPGLYVAGDASEELQLIILAAAEGAKAAYAINTAFQKEELR
jgi:thioredoxin reductase